MKINKIAGICKRAGMIRLYDEHTGDMQWCGTDAAIYPLYSLPVLDGDNVGPVMNFSDKELKNIVVEHLRIPLRYDVNDTAEGEIYRRAHIPVRYRQQCLQRLPASGNARCAVHQRSVPQAAARRRG